MSNDMLGRARRELDALPPDLHGVALDFLTKLGDPGWVDPSKRFLRKENPFPRVRVHKPVIWPENSFHDPLVASLPAIPAGEYWKSFREDWNDGLYFRYVDGFDWDKLCGDFEEETSPCDFSSRSLRHYKSGKAFPENLGKDFTLGQILYILRASDRSQLPGLGLKMFSQYFPVGRYVVRVCWVCIDYVSHWHVGYFKKSERRNWRACDKILVVN